MPLPRILAPGQLGPHPVSALIMDCYKAQINPTIIKDGHGIGLQVFRFPLQHYLFICPIEKVITFYSRHLSPQIPKRTRYPNILTQCWSPQSIVVCITCDFDPLNTLSLRPLNTVIGKAHRQSLKKSLIPARRIRIDQVFEYSGAMRTTHDYVVLSTPFELRDSQGGLLPRNPVSGNSIAHTHPSSTRRLIFLPSLFDRHPLGRVI